MQSIKFQGGFVQNLSPEASRIDVIQNGINQVKGSMDRRISNRNAIGAKLAQAGLLVVLSV
jgi:hypothetical protein